MRTSFSSVLRVWPAACAVLLSLLLPAASDAAGLGRITVLSGLGQPLNAEIELNASKDELSTMMARIATVEAYRRANLEYSAFVASVRLNIEQRRDGSMLVRATSVRAVNDPFLELLVELIWSSGRLVREYTMLIDPPGFTAPETVSPPVAATRPAAVDAQPLVATPLAPAALPAAAAAKPAPTVKAPADKPAPRAPRAAAESSVAQSASAGGESYGPVQRGDTLGKIAESVRPSGVSLDQMLVSLFRENKGAFDGNNMNRLRTGAVLRVPDASAAAAASAGEAAREVRAQAADFNAYRQRLAGAVQDAPPVAEGGQAVSGKITPKVEEKVPAPAPGTDVLRLSKGEASKAGAARDPKAATAAREEDATAREKSLREANERVAALEKMLKDAQRLLDVQSKQLADLQKMSKGEPAKAAEPAKPEPVKSDPVKPEPVKPEPKPLPTVEPVPPKPAPEVVPSVAPPVDAPKPPVDAPKPKPVAPPPPPPPSMVDQAIAFVTQYAMELGGALVALLGLVWLAMKRKANGSAPKKGKTATATEPKFGPSAKAASAEAAVGADEVLQTSPGRPPASPEEEVDPLAEAEVYLTYGRDAQAEGILREAITRTPARHELHLKLLEIYMKRGDAKSFESVATDLFAGTGGQGVDWMKAAEMGASIDPSNPLYAAGKASNDASGANLATIAGVGAAGLAAAAAAAAVTTGGARAPIEHDKTQILTVEDTAAMAPESVDFDFEPATSGGTTTQNDPDATVLIAGTPGETVAAPPADMDFTLDFGSVDASAAPMLPDLPLEAAADGTATSEADLSLDAGNNTGPMSSVVVDPMFQSQATNVLLDSGPPTGSILDFKLEAARAEAAEAAASAAAGQPTLPPMSEATMIMANPGELVTFDMTHPAGLPQNWQETTLPRVDLDLGDTASDGRNPNKDEHWNDVNTKYDLAKAYEEMGDKDGAREILREVIAEGDDQQKAEAESMLARLG